ESESASRSSRKRSGYLPVKKGSYHTTAEFGTPGSYWASGYHTGLDFAAPEGTTVRAVESGTVVSAGWAGAYGNRVVVKSSDGDVLEYSHLSDIDDWSGWVRAGEKIGEVGATGNVTGPHLHLEYRPGYGD